MRQCGGDWDISLACITGTGRDSERDSLGWMSVCCAQISTLLKAGETPITQFPIFEISSIPILLAKEKPIVERVEDFGILVLFLLTLHRPGCYLLQNQELEEQKGGIWAEMIKEWVHPRQKSLVPVVLQSSCRLRIAGWRGSSSCRLPCFLSLHLQKATRNISSSLLRQFPCTQAAEQVHLCSHSRTC